MPELLGDFEASFDLFDSALRDCCASRSRTGVAPCSSRLPIAPATFTAVPLVVLRAVGMPRFSARLLAIEGCGSLRRDVGGVGDSVDEEMLLLVTLFEVAVLVVLSEACAVVLLCFFSRGASLIRPASLRWWSSRRLRMRRAYTYIRYFNKEGAELFTPQHCECPGRLHEKPSPRGHAPAPQ
jgi:hypothetical protein